MSLGQFIDAYNFVNNEVVRNEKAKSSAFYIANIWPYHFRLKLVQCKIIQSNSMTIYGNKYFTYYTEGLKKNLYTRYYMIYTVLVIKNLTFDFNPRFKAYFLVKLDH